MEPKHLLTRHITFFKQSCKWTNTSNYLTPRSRVLLENLTATQLVKTFPTFYGTQRFITVFATAHHWSLS
jgi:hypothetical protein